MKEEIKEILEVNGKKYNINLPKEVKEAFTCIDYELSVCSCELPEILDYITNLQEENEELKNTIDFIDNKYKNTINYNEKLIEYNQDYKQRNEKAIEFMNNTFSISNVKDMFNIMNELENILKGDKNE